MIFSCVVPFKSKKKKIPDLSLPPCSILYCTSGRGGVNKGEEKESVVPDTETVNINFKGAHESIPRNRFRQSMQLGGPIL